MNTLKRIDVTLAERLKEIRTHGKFGKLSQLALSEKAWISVITYMKIEHWDTQNPSFLTIWKICNALWYSLDEFVEGLGMENS